MFDSLKKISVKRRDLNFRYFFKLGFVTIIVWIVLSGGVGRYYLICDAVDQARSTRSEILLDTFSLWTKSLKFLH